MPIHLYCALIAYIIFEGPAEDRNMNTLVDMISGMEVKEDNENFMNAVDYMFKGLEKRKPDCFAVKQYKKYKLASGVVCSKRLLNQAVGKSLRTHNLKPKKGAQVMRKNEKITALYERLSRDDFGKDDDQQRESNSISNQKAMLEEFAARQGFTNIVHFTDDGISKQCDIVRDILPLYVDGACSEASAEMVKEHLNACADCNAIYQKLLSHTSEDVLHEESESVIMRHEAKEKQRGRKKITIAVLVSIALCIIAIFTALFLLPINIAYEPVKIDFPFEVEDVENVEMYHYDGVPASAEKKVVVAENDIKTLYDKFKGLSLKDKTTEETAGADVTSFRFNLSNGTSYDLIYACYGVKNGELKSAAGGFKYFTSADIGSYWNNLNTELEAIPINESELP